MTPGKGSKKILTKKTNENLAERPQTQNPKPSPQNLCVVGVCDADLSEDARAPRQAKGSILGRNRAHPVDKFQFPPHIVGIRNS